MNTTPPPEDGDRVSNRQLYDALTGLEGKVEAKLEPFATKDDVKVWVLGGLLGGQVVASAVTALITRMSPPQQVKAVAAFTYHLFF